MQALLEYARDDARQVYIRVTAAFAIVALLPHPASPRKRPGAEIAWTNTLYFGLASTLAGGFLYFFYVGATHHVHREIAKYLLQPERVTLTEPDNLLTDVWRKRQLVTFWLGGTLFGGGLTLLGVVLAKIVSLSP